MSTQFIKPDNNVRLLAFEGLDATGKTRIGKTVCERVQGKYCHTPGEAYQELRYQLHPKKGLSTLLLYLTSCAQAYEDWQQNSDLVIDRFWFSSLVHYGWEAKWQEKDFRAAMEIVLAYFPVPDFTIFLWSELEVRQARLESRVEMDSFHSAPSEAFDEWWRGCAHLVSEAPEMNTLWVDTSDGDEVSAIEKVLTHVCN